ERALAETASADNLQHLPARVALGEIAWLDERPSQAIEPMAAMLAEVESDLGAGHSMVVQAHLLLAALHAQAGDADAASRHANEANAGLALLPAGHPLHARREMYTQQ